MKDRRSLTSVEAAAFARVHDRGGGTVTVFAVNQHLIEDMYLDLALGGLDGEARVVGHQVMTGHDLRATNGPDRPDAIVLLRVRGATAESEGRYDVTTRPSASRSRAAELLKM